jgi:aldose sugar dehydrogenase
MKLHPFNAALLSVTMLVGAPFAYAQSGEPVDQAEPNVPTFQPAFPEQTRAPASDSEVPVSVETFASSLEHPWGIDVLPNDEGYLVTERPGRLRVISADGDLSDPITGLPDVFAEDQGGLLDVRVGPTFSEDRLVYWTYAKPLDEGQSATAAARGRLSDDRSELTDVEDIFVQEPPSASPMHYGARILFDDDGHAFITTGERFTEEERVLAQDLGTTYGKIVRVSLDGSVPGDNPFVDQGDAIDTIWSYGHRNIQGAAIHPETGQLWAIEHGPQGGDELNLIEAGANYGWPVVSYGENYDGTPVGEGIERHAGEMVEPRYYWDPVIAPAGAIFYQGDMFAEWQGDLLVSSLTPGGLVRLEIDGDMVTGEERLISDQGRIRDVVEAPDGSLLVLVDDADGSVLRLTVD